MNGQDDQLPERKAWHFKIGVWAEAGDPVMDAWEAVDWKGDEESVLKSLGYELLFQAGERLLYSGFAVWCRDDSPRHVLATGVDELTQFLYIDAYPDLLTIAAQWVPLVRDLTIIDFIDGLSESERYGKSVNYRGLVESIARRSRQGWES